MTLRHALLKLAPLAAAALGLMTTAPSGALAQSALDGTSTAKYINLPVDPALANDPTAYGVLERPRPNSDAIGIPVGSFRLTPYILGSVAYDDNVYSQPSSGQKKSDFVSRVAPSFDLQSNWNRHSLNVNGGVEAVYYRDLTDEDQTNAKAGFNGTIDVMRDLRIRYNGDWARQHEERSITDQTTAGFVDRPIQYDRQSFGVAVERRFNHLVLTVGGSYERTDYSDGFGAGIVIDQQFRNFATAASKVRLGYEFSPSAAFFAEGGYDRRNYFSSDLSSDGQRIVVGFAGELSRLVKGEVYAGALARQYDLASIGDARAFTYGGTLDWHVTPLLTLVMNGERGFSDTGYGGLGYFLQSKIGMRADYELRRDVIVSGNVGYEWDDYQQTVRNDKILTSGISVTYLVNRNLKIALNYKHSDRHSNGNGFDYDRNTAILSAKVQY